MANEIVSLRQNFVHISKRGVMTERIWSPGLGWHEVQTKFASKSIAGTYARGLGYRTTRKRKIWLNEVSGGAELSGDEKHLT